MLRVFLTTLLLTLISISAHAEIFEWQSNNVQLLHGSGFELTEDRQTTFTFEHADSWKYGDNFFYIDYPFDVPDDVNAEFSPRLSAGKISGTDLSYGIFKDLLLAGTYEMGRNFKVYLYGVGIDLDIPGFNFMQMNYYVRDNPDASGKGLQTTWAWSRPFEIGSAKFTFDGYFDYADYEEGDVNFFTQPQILYDIGDGLGFAEPGHAWVGAEYRYWYNKFGIDGVEESVPQVMVKWAF
jgi:nucleoside-specific outer membrane channel protein Tsx